MSNNDATALAREGDDEEIDPTMILKAHEHHWALQLKDAVELDSDNSHLHPLSDFMYVHHAIAAKGNIQKALARIEGLQSFCEEYGIDGSAMQGVYAVQQHQELHPGSVLFVDDDRTEQNYHGCSIIAWDLGKIHPERVFQLDKEMSTDRHWKIHARGVFYTVHVLYPNFQTIRNGNIVLVEGSNFGWENFSTKCENRLQEEFFHHYPSNPKKVMWYNTNTVINTLVGMVKPLLPKHIKEAFEVGCTVEDGVFEPTDAPTLGNLFLQPSPEIAHLTLLRRVGELLEERNKNERTFEL